MPVGNGVQQAQTTNKFAALEVEEVENVANNQLALADKKNTMRSPNLTPTKNGKSLNAADPVFNPNSSRNRAPQGNNGNIASVNKEQKGAYLPQLVTTNQSCQYIPSQAQVTGNVQLVYGVISRRRI